MHILAVDFNVSLESVGWVSVLKRFSRLPTEMNRTKEAPCSTYFFKTKPQRNGAQKEANIPR